MQYTDNVIGPGSPSYDNAYFMINYVRVYTVDALSPFVSSSSYHTRTSIGGTPSYTGGSGSISNTGTVFDVSSSLYPYFLLCIGAFAVFI